jgi:hypothetical protein
VPRSSKRSLHLREIISLDTEILRPSVGVGIAQGRLQVAPGELTAFEWWSCVARAIGSALFEICEVMRANHQNVACYHFETLTEHGRPGLKFAATGIEGVP